MFGWRGKLLRVDLTSRKIWEEDLTRTYTDGYIGGAGINARLLYDLLRHNPHAAPLSPENPLISAAVRWSVPSFPAQAALP
jgi:aldehyde:ferredoxin oxidoreductase